MKVTFRQLSTQAQWLEISEILPVLKTEDTEGVIAYDQNDKLLGAFLYDNWTPNSVQVHIGLINPLVLRHGFLNLCIDYAFNHRGRRYMFAMILGDNHKSLRLVKKMGAKEVVRLMDAWDDGIDYVMMKLDREDLDPKWEVKDVPQL